MGRGIDIIERSCEDKGFIIWGSAVAVVGGGAGAEQSSTIGVSSEVELGLVREARGSVTERVERRVEEAEGVLYGAVYSHCHGVSVLRFHCSAVCSELLLLTEWPFVASCCGRCHRLQNG